MSVTDQERLHEQRRVDDVREKLRRGIERDEPIVSGLRSQVVEMRKNFWDDVTVNLSTGDDILETAISMKQQAEVLSERERSHRHLQARLNRMKRLYPSPYFGRIDFREDGEAEAERIYIGIASFEDEDDGTYLIYDWRTPVASLYYDYAPGPVQYETPAGTIGGTMELKRQFQIRDGVIRALFDTGITIGDELLQQVLGKGAESRMQSIVATIQQEQNRIIRNDRSRMLIVQGAAGSGKTSAALQRVAYLLYKHRERLTADQMVLFSPNPLFNSYVSSVLPELGEENMQQTTFQEYLEHRLGDVFRLEDPYDQMEYMLTARHEPDYEARMAGIRYKASERFLAAVQSFGKRLLAGGMAFRSIRFQGRTLVSAEEMERQFYSCDPAIRLANRVHLLKEWLLQRLNELEKAERSADWVTEEMNYLDNEQYQLAYNQLRKRQKGKDPAFDDAVQEEELIRAYLVKERFKPLRRSVKRLRFADVTSLYRQLLNDPETAADFEAFDHGAGTWPQIAEASIRRLDAGELAYEDATPYLYLKELVEGFQTNNTIRYVLIDEAQDYSPFQFEFLKRLFPRSRMTALGDFNQAIFTHAVELASGDTPIARLFGEAETERITLRRSYRSTREIVEFTRQMLPDGHEIEPFDRSGGLPAVVFAANEQARIEAIASDMADLLTEGFGSVAVICKTAAESAAAYEALKNVCPHLTLVDKHTASFEQGTVVIPSYLAKGVEFDAVLIYDASAETYGAESERKLFYTACTRAMHRLRLYAVGEPTPFLAGVSPSSYSVVERP